MDSNQLPSDTPLVPPPPFVEPAPAMPPGGLVGWFRQNGLRLALLVAFIAVICRFLHPLDVLFAGLGMTLIIFLHELGHFTAAKLCDVHVRTFSIGFGPALPFCQYKYGETTYKLAMVPLGGYVAMVGEDDPRGEGDGPDEEAAAEHAASDPRSFKNKSVPKRMFIISAGVIMNVILGGICFVVTYMHGVDERPATAAYVETGSAAWRAGWHSGTEVKSLNGRENIYFDDIRPTVQSTDKGETVDLEVDYKGSRERYALEPLKLEGALYPQLGVLSHDKLVLRNFKRDDLPPYMPSSPAAKAGNDSHPGFLPGDRIVAMTDPDDTSKVTPIQANWDNLPGEYFDYYRRLVRLAGKPVTVHVVRKGDATETAVAVYVLPGFRKDVGLRMRMGAISAIRKNSPAEQAQIQARQAEGDQVSVPGDRIVAVEFPEKDRSVTKYTADPKGTEKPLDPLRFPDQAEAWADNRPPGAKVKLTVLRDVDHTERPLELLLDWDPNYKYEIRSVSNAGTPVAVNGLGLAYHVNTLVDAVAPNSAAAGAGLQANDQIMAIRFKVENHKGVVTDGDWDNVRPHQWAFVDQKLQLQAPFQFEVKYKRGSTESTAWLTAADDTTWPVVERGLVLMPETRLQKADGVIDAVGMGFHRTLRTIKSIYQGLYSIAFGRTSVKVMSGPITLAQQSYFIAGQDTWTLLLWMGLISINLAVVNFLPIPVLDGGHMVFLVYEWIRGKPAPISVQNICTYIGLGLIGSMMLFVIGKDIWTLFIA